MQSYEIIRDYTLLMSILNVDSPQINPIESLKYQKKFTEEIFLGEY